MEQKKVVYFTYEGYPDLVFAVFHGFIAGVEAVYVKVIPAGEAVGVATTFDFKDSSVGTIPASEMAYRVVPDSAPDAMYLLYLSTANLIVMYIQQEGHTLDGRDIEFLQKLWQTLSAYADYEEQNL